MGVSLMGVGKKVVRANLVNQPTVVEYVPGRPDGTGHGKTDSVAFEFLDQSPQHEDCRAVYVIDRLGIEDDEF